MNADFLGLTLQVTGEIVIAYTVLRVHYRVRKEHKIDDRVFRIMKKEQTIGLIGIGFILVGYMLQIPAKLF